MILAWTLRLILASVALFWLGVARRVARGRQDTRFRITPDDPLPDGLPGLTVVIPARNEEGNVGPCLHSVLAQDLPDLEVVVLDDASTDGTAAELASFARDPRVKIIRGDGEPPAGWLGKPWALQRAQAHATRPWLLFLDADVRLHPRAASRTLAYALRHDLGMVSGFGTLVALGFWEKVLQPAIGGLVIAGNDLGEVNDPGRPEKAMANGQFILFSREAYAAVGEHRVVMGNVVDDVGLARAAKERGVPAHCVFMRSLFECRMYRSFREIWHGWRKNLFVGMHRSWAVVLGVTAFLAVENLLPWVVLAWGLATGSGEWIAWGAGLVILIQAVRFYLDRVFGQPPLLGVTHPLAMVLVILLVLDSAWSTSRGQVTWKGRTVSSGAGSSG